MVVLKHPFPAFRLEEEISDLLRHGRQQAGIVDQAETLGQCPSCRLQALEGGFIGGEPGELIGALDAFHQEGGARELIHILNLPVAFPHDDVRKTVFASSYEVDQAGELQLHPIVPGKGVGKLHRFRFRKGGDEGDIRLHVAHLTIGCQMEGASIAQTAGRDGKNRAGSRGGVDEGFLALIAVWPLPSRNGDDRPVAVLGHRSKEALLGRRLGGAEKVSFCSRELETTGNRHPCFQK